MNNIKKITNNGEWNFSKNKEFLMHKIHSYPAKFPAFIAENAFEYAEKEGVNLNRIADVFCGCGTVALEAKIHNKEFWGCDINPVAILIAETKSNMYNLKTFNNYFDKICRNILDMDIPDEIYEQANERLKYWFTKNSFVELYKIKYSILKIVPKGKYRKAFLCIFSSILKGSSKWLTKSIKPQLDPLKKEKDIQKYFGISYSRFIKAINEINSEIKSEKKIILENRNFFDVDVLRIPKVDLFITSPPYVTSYEYADLHQLSTLWLDYAEDFRDLRKGSVGSIYNSEGYNFNIKKLNKIGRNIVKDLEKTDKNKSRIKSVIRYYSDMQKVVLKAKEMLNRDGMIFFVIGDTEYKGVKILNSKHLIEELNNNGFKDIKIGKRLISNKLLSPYRDISGKFSSDKFQRKIYHEEYIISGRR